VRILFTVELAGGELHTRSTHDDHAACSTSDLESMNIAEYAQAAIARSGK